MGEQLCSLIQSLQANQSTTNLNLDLIAIYHNKDITEPLPSCSKLHHIFENFRLGVDQSGQHPGKA
jgi:hypothetical protein